MKIECFFMIFWMCWLLILMICLWYWFGIWKEIDVGIFCFIRVRFCFIDL